MQEWQEKLEQELQQLRAEMRAEFRAEIKQLKEQHTEEIKVTRVELASADVTTRLDKLEQGQEDLKKDTTVLKDEVGVIKIEMQGARADILQLRESQADLRDKVVEHGKLLKAVKDDQDRHTEALGNLMDFAESHNAILKTVATKEDIKNMATKDDISRIEDLIKQLLPKPPES